MFHILGIGVPSSLSNAYDPDSRLALRYTVPPSLAGTFWSTDRLCSQKLFSGPGPL